MPVDMKKIHQFKPGEPRLLLQRATGGVERRFAAADDAARRRPARQRAGDERHAGAAAAHDRRSFLDGRGGVLGGRRGESRPSEGGRATIVAASFRGRACIPPPLASHSRAAPRGGGTALATGSRMRGGRRAPAGDARAGGDGGPFRRFHGERIMRETNDKQQRGNVTQRHDTPAAPGGNRVTQAFERFAARVTQWAGSPVAFGVAVAITIGWLACGPLVHFSDAWQLVINTGTTIITFLMVFLLQRNQNRDSVALHLKLDELVAATKSASNRLIGIEDASEDELKRLAHAYLELALRARTLRETSGEPARRDADDDSDGDGDDAASEAQERPTPAD